MKSKKLMVLMWILALLPLTMVLLSRPFLPDEVPIHWGWNGEVRYAGKAALWFLAAIPIVLSVLYQVLPYLDPKHENYQKFQGFYDMFGVVLPFFLSLLMAITLTETFRPGSLHVGRVVVILVSLLLLFIGGMMGKVKSNWFMGIRTPWALADPDVWNKTQRLGGWVFFLSGLIELPFALLAPETIMYSFLLVSLLGGSVLTCFMSWQWFHKTRK